MLMHVTWQAARTSEDTLVAARLALSLFWLPTEVALPQFGVRSHCPINVTLACAHIHVSGSAHTARGLTGLVFKAAATMIDSQRSFCLDE